ncbi:Vps52-domain-containing protein [Heliocybe sulcata]|uniref:Vps52-domain-containing protein n=1 Tax=Heliocybe sulcata TaxID=5364 RepID=A0A5C3NII8_9AGAM|nr:Vps52-domain-containing protein [Heliocybe sulcata]
MVSNFAPPAKLDTSFARRVSTGRATVMSGFEESGQNAVPPHFTRDNPGPSSFRQKANEYVELHDQVETSVTLLDSIESFLSTFQKDLSAVSGQISELQERSQDIDRRLKSRKKIEKPLSSLIEDLIIPPPLATLILDSDCGEPWILAVEQLERLIGTYKARMRVKAAKELAEVAEGLRIIAATKCRGFFLALIRPMRHSMSTNIQVIQTSVFLKYKPLFTFLQRQAPEVAQEIQKTYISSARTYYETGFRRYIRSLGWIKARTVEKSEYITTGGDLDTPESLSGRLGSARLDGPGVTLAYMADDKAHKEPMEALLRSALLVLMDNATAEYAFVTSFFSTEQPPLPAEAAISPTSLLSPTDGTFDDRVSLAGSERGGITPRPPGRSIAGAMASAQVAKEERASMDAAWKQIFDPTLDYCQTFVRTLLDPVPPVVQLLTMIRLTEEVMAEVQKRDCPPLESFIFRLRLEMWPLFQKGMAEHVDAVKKLAEGATAGFFSRGALTTDAQVATICQRYITIFNSFILLTQQPEETMIFSNLSRLRQEVDKLVMSHSEKAGDVKRQATTQSRLYELVLQGLNRLSNPTAHPKVQAEMEYWRKREEDARKRISGRT